MHEPVPPVGYAPAEVRTGEPTRSARLKWVIVVADALPAGLAANAAVCTAPATAVGVPGLLRPGRLGRRQRIRERRKPFQAQPRG